MRWLLFGAMMALTSSIAAHTLLTDPMLQDPDPSSVKVVWFTEFPGQDHYVEYGEGLQQKAIANIQKLSRMREDGESGCIYRPIYRHEATLSLSSSQRALYRAVSHAPDGETVASKVFSCMPAPQPGTPSKILFTSDHQLKPMVAANLQKVKEACPQIDAVFFAGDTVNRPDRASEWFDEEGAFFPCFQGRASRKLGNAVYTGGAILQYAPMFCAIGNHEVMGRWSMKTPLDEQYNDTYPREAAQKQLNDPATLKDRSFNTDTYEELFSLPTSPSGGKTYYATTYGDVRLVVLYATRIWRKPFLGVKGKYTENPQDFDRPDQWGYGDFIFEPLEKGSPQYQWLETELQSPEFRQAKYKIVMLHNPLHSLGENSIPPYTPPLQQIDRDAQGKITHIRYHYPKDQDYLIRDIEPLFVKYGVQLVLSGHTHIWNRFQSKEGTHYLETSNVGNSYGAYLEAQRSLVPGKGDENYRATGEPNGLSPIVPTIAPLCDAEGKPLPYLSSNEITAFSIFDTESGAIDSYYFNTAKPDSAIIHFDRFYIGQEKTPLGALTSLHAQKVVK